MIMAYTYKYPRPAVTADCIVVTKEAEPKVLLIQRGNPPFKGAWAFPGGFMDMDETTEQCQGDGGRDGASTVGYSSDRRILQG